MFVQATHCLQLSHTSAISPPQEVQGRCFVVVWSVRGDQPRTPGSDPRKRAGSDPHRGGLQGAEHERPGGCASDRDWERQAELVTQGSDDQGRGKGLHSTGVHLEGIFTSPLTSDGPQLCDDGWQGWAGSWTRGRPRGAWGWGKAPIEPPTTLMHTV